MLKDFFEWCIYHLVTCNLYFLFQSQVDHLFHNYNRRIGPNITKLMSVHWKLSDLNELVSDCVRVDLMFMSICSTIRVIYFMFSMLRFLEESIQKPGSKFSSFQSLIFMVTVVGPFVSLCFRCNRVVQEVSWCFHSLSHYYHKKSNEKETNKNIHLRGRLCNFEKVQNELMKSQSNCYTSNKIMGEFVKQFHLTKST